MAYDGHSVPLMGYPEEYMGDIIIHQHDDYRKYSITNGSVLNRIEATRNMIAMPGIYHFHCEAEPKCTKCGNYISDKHPQKYKGKHYCSNCLTKIMGYR